MHQRFPALALAGWALLVAFGADAAAPNPRERIDFWQKNYTALSAETDPRVARAQEIFARLVSAAGRRAAVQPRLHVIAEDPANVALPIAIPDGWIVLSRRVLDLCYRTPARGDDRLAFVLAHEVAHQLDDDFWHMKFFQAIETLAADPNERRVQTELRDIAAQTDKLAAKELRADEQGIALAAIAGFDTGAIVGDADADNFFREWEAEIDPARLTAPRPVRSHPEAAQRAAAVKARLRQIREHTELFQIGLLLYQAGEFEDAIRAFSEFQRYFPAREVNHNLGTAHHQLALAAMPPASNSEAVPFKLAVAVDTLTRAGRVRAQAQQQQQFRRHMSAALEYYDRALAQDASYLPVYRNLAAAHLHNGAPYRAVAILQDALKAAPDDAALLNNLGVALFHTKNVTEAREVLERARRADPAYDAPLFNLANLAQRSGDLASAQRYGQRYLERDPNSDWARLIRTRYNVPAQSPPSPQGPFKPEALAGVEVGTYDHELPKDWGTAAVKLFPLDTDVETRIARYSNNVLAITTGGEIRQLATLPGYRGESARGIRAGSRREDVEARYGAPTQVLSTTTGESLMYRTRGITFNVRNGRVVSWLLYWE